MMCKQCKHKTGSTKHLLYWQAEWFVRFVRTWWHIINRKAYHSYIAGKIADREIARLTNDFSLTGMREGGEYWPNFGMMGEEDEK